MRHNEPVRDALALARERVAQEQANVADARRALRNAVAEMERLKALVN